MSTRFCAALQESIADLKAMVGMHCTRIPTVLRTPVVAVA